MISLFTAVCFTNLGVAQFVHPEVIIQDGYFLDDSVSEYRDKGRLSEDEHQARIVGYRKKWDEYEARILDGMYAATGLKFRSSIIEVYITNKLKGTFSAPLHIPNRYAPDEFVGVLAHELCHRLITRNDKRLDVAEIWRGLFSYEDNGLVRNHIFVHALMQFIYLDVLNDSVRLTKEIESCARYPLYKKAWDHVQERGYKNILSQLRSYYESAEGGGLGFAWSVSPRF